MRSSPPFGWSRLTRQGKATTRPGAKSGAYGAFLRANAFRRGNGDESGGLGVEVPMVAVPLPLTCELSRGGRVTHQLYHNIVQ